MKGVNLSQYPNHHPCLVLRTLTQCLYNLIVTLITMQGVSHSRGSFLTQYPLQLTHHH